MAVATYVPRSGISPEAEVAGMRHAGLPWWWLHDTDPLLCAFYDAGLFLPEELNLKPAQLLTENDLSVIWNAVWDERTVRE